jgi:small neutral amino acid transporter SnatA (MarC family)
MSPTLLDITITYLIVAILLIICATYAYYVNSKRAADDPKKKNYHPVAIVLTPFSFPILFVLSISFFLLRVLAYGAFLVLFLLALIFIRKPFILEWLRKTVVKVGDRLLAANTLLVRFFLSPWRDYQGST